MEEYFRVRAYISEKALRHNARIVKEKIGPGVTWMAVVKADAYGHGIDHVVPILEQEGAGAYAVATLEEAVQVRRLVKDKPILILGYTDAQQYQEALSQQISLTIYTVQQALALSETAGALGVNARVHIKLETGMGRIGFACAAQSVQEIETIWNLPHLTLEGLFTHFARADEADKEQARLQQERFDRFAAALAERGIVPSLYHTANSAAIMEFPEAFSHWPKTKLMVRAGIMLYGLYPSDEMDREQTRLMPVLRLLSLYVYLLEVEKGTPIGYGGTYVAPGKRRIATIPVGYGDGYPRRLSGLGYVMIRGARAPITGRVCMDQLMVDVTDISDVSLGEEVVLIGQGVEAETLAALSQTIHYEIVCQLTNRVPRVMEETSPGV